MRGYRCLPGLSATRSVGFSRSRPPPHELPGFVSCVLPLHGLPGINFGATNVLADGEVREGIKKFTGWPTIPQVGHQALRLPMRRHVVEAGGPEVVRAGCGSLWLASPLAVVDKAVRDTRSRSPGRECGLPYTHVCLRTRVMS